MGLYEATTSRIFPRGLVEKRQAYTPFIIALGMSAAAWRVGAPSCASQLGAAGALEFPFFLRPGEPHASIAAGSNANQGSSDALPAKHLASHLIHEDKAELVSGIKQRPQMPNECCPYDSENFESAANRKLDAPDYEEQLEQLPSLGHHVHNHIPDVMSHA